MTAMLNPPHPGETLRHDCIEASGLTVTEAARLLASRPVAPAERTDGDIARNGHWA